LFDDDDDDDDDDGGEDQDPNEIDVWGVEGGGGGDSDGDGAVAVPRRRMGGVVAGGEPFALSETVGFVDDRLRAVQKDLVTLLGTLPRDDDDDDDDDSWHGADFAPRNDVAARDDNDDFDPRNDVAPQHRCG
jgi:hypothetical protein